MRSLGCLLALALTAPLAACGGGAPAATTATRPTASTPERVTPPPDATQPGTGPVTTTMPDEGTRVPVTFTIVAGGLRPRIVTVPPGLPVELAAIAADGRAHRLVLATDPPAVLVVEGGTSAAQRLPGLAAGRYRVSLDGRVAGAVVAGGDVGP